VYALCGEIRTMPGLPHDPAGAHFDLDANGEVTGPF
jgi:formate--tetrahydrofolate ligase